MLSENELNWIRDILSEDGFFGEISPSYFHRLKLEAERTQKKGIVRKELDALQKKITKYTPQDLHEIRNKQMNAPSETEYITGIYIIHNSDRDIYYVGQSKNMVKRAWQHFMLNAGNPDLYEHYCLGEKITISLIPLVSTSFSSLDDLEDYAIRAYDSILNGYNQIPGKIMVKPIFKNEDYRKVADLILNDIKESEVFFSLSNDKKRRRYIFDLFLELNLPKDFSFVSSFSAMIKEYKKDNPPKLRK